jgi:hypothetical protein
VGIEDGRVEGRPPIPLFGARKGHYPPFKRIFEEINEGRILGMTKGSELSHNIRWSIEPTAHSSKAVDH